MLKRLDDLLRGSATRPDRLLEGAIELPLRTFLPLAVLLGALYGFFMGWYGILIREPPEYQQLLASTIKLPALFLLTLVVTFPSLYVFNALVGCRLSFNSTLRLLVSAIVVNLAVAASLGPVLAFFTVSTTSYPFMVVLNVMLLSISGMVGLGFLLQTLRRLSAAGEADWKPATVSAQPMDSAAGAAASTRQPGPLEHVEGLYTESGMRASRNIFRIWVILFGLVGAQMGWLLRPFIGRPDAPFTWFRSREGNFFLGLMQHIKTLLDPGS